MHQGLEIIKRGQVMSGVVPSNERPHVLCVVQLLAVPPMGSNGSNPVDLRVRGAGERSICYRLSRRSKAEISISHPMLGVFYFNNKNSPKEL